MRLSVDGRMIWALLGLAAILLGASGCAVMTDVVACTVSLCQ